MSMPESMSVAMPMSMTVSVSISTVRITVQNVDHGSHRHRSDGMHRGTVAAPAAAAAAAAAVQLHSGWCLGRSIGLDLGKPHPLWRRMDMSGWQFAAGGTGTAAAGQMHTHGLGVRRRYPRIWRSAGVAAHHTQRRTELHRVVRMMMVRVVVVLLLLLQLLKLLLLMLLERLVGQLLVRR